MHFALAQINPIVGDIEGNCEKIAAWAVRARDAGADVVIFPELAVVGYPPKDLLLKPSFVRANVEAVEALARRCEGVTVIVGFVDVNEQPAGRRLYNAAAVLRDGRIAAVHRKTLLPTYDVFDESRYFEASTERKLELLVAAGGRAGAAGERAIAAGITICEDLWNEETFVRQPLYHVNPVAELAKVGANVVVNISASPFDVEKNATRTELFAAQARRHAVPVIYVNQVGGNDDLVFDGASVVFDAGGRVIARAKAFEEDLLVVELDEPGEGTHGPVAARKVPPGRRDLPGARIEPYPESVERIYQALVLGTRDYVRKTGFKSVVLGLSGGIDSALTAAIAVDALGAEAVRGVALPSRYSSDHSISDARLLAENLGIRFDVIPIEQAHEAMEGVLTPVFKGLAPDVTEENVQARIRGNILMALSNKFGSLLLTTGNKSELAVGYCTMYGDMCGGLAVISDVPKTTVYDLSRLVNRRAGRDLIPQGTLTKPPSAELRPNQTDQDSLPPYEVLDPILKAYIEEHRSVEEIVAAGFDQTVVREVIRKVDCNEFKRKQAAPGIKVTSTAFGTGRRMPIAARYSF